MLIFNIYVRFYSYSKISKLILQSYNQFDGREFVTEVNTKDKPNLKYLKSLRKAKVGKR